MAHDPIGDFVGFVTTENNITSNRGQHEAIYMHV